MAALTAANKTPMSDYQPNFQRIYTSESSSQMAGTSLPVNGNIPKIYRASEAIEIKQSKVMQTLVRESGTYLSVNVMPPNNMVSNDHASHHPSSYSSDNSYKDFILNPAAFSHMIEAPNSSSLPQHISLEEGTASARRKAAPRMGIRRLNYAPLEEKVVSSNISSMTGKYGDKSLGRIDGAQISSKRLGNHTRSCLSLNTGNINDLKSTCIFNNPTLFEIEASKPKYKDASNQTSASLKQCKCSEIKAQREQELAKQVKVLFNLSVVGCIVFLPIGIIALMLSIRAKHLNSDRSRIGFSEPYALAMTPHYHAQQVNSITKQLLFAINAAKYCLLAETILILLVAIAYGLYAGVWLKSREIFTFLFMIVGSSSSPGITTLKSMNSGSKLNAYYANDSITGNTSVAG